jgi:hypothetical protein
MARPAQLKDSMLNMELWSDLPPEQWYRPGDGEYARVRAAPECAHVPLIASLGYDAKAMQALVPHMDALVDAYEFSCHYTELSEVRALASALRSNTRKPIFAKLSPHGHNLTELALELRKCGVDGFVVMNSFGPCLAVDVETEQPLLGGKEGKGWLSGQAIRPIALYWVSQLARAMPDVPVIGVGGVSTWRDAVEFFLAGATAVQVCTAAIYRGPKVFAEINDGIAAYLRRRGFTNVSQLRGRALAKCADYNYEPGLSTVDTSRCIYCGACAVSCTFKVSVFYPPSHLSLSALFPILSYTCGSCALFNFQ